MVIMRIARVYSPYFVTEAGKLKVVGQFITMVGAVGIISLYFFYPYWIR